MKDDTSAESISGELERARLAQMTKVMEETAIRVAKEAASVTLVEAARVAKSVVNDAAETAVQLLKRSGEQLTNISVISNDISYIKKDIGDIKIQIEKHYVSKDEFTPVRNIVYGLVGILGIATISAVLKLVLKI